MDNVAAVSETKRPVETSACCGGACLCSELKETAKRLEKIFNDSKQDFSAKLEDGRAAAERFVKRSRYAMEDGIEETTHQMKRHPLGFFAIAFTAGAAFGLLVPYLSKMGGNTDPRSV